MYNYIWVTWTGSICYMGCGYEYVDERESCDTIYRWCDDVCMHILWVCENFSIEIKKEGVLVDPCEQHQVCVDIHLCSDKSLLKITKNKMVICKMLSEIETKNPK